LPAGSTDAAAVTLAIDSEAQRFGRLDILVNSAGILIFAPVEQFTLVDFEKIVAINIRGVFVATQASAGYMKEGGRVINLGSIVARRMPLAGGAIYSMDKSALTGLVKGLARDAAQRDGPEAP